MATIEATELKELKGKRITIDGERHRVAKVAIRAGTVTTDDGTEVAVDGIYKRGRGYFFDTPKKGKKTTAATKTKVKAKADDEAPVETARQRRRREKKEAEEAAGGTGSRRARSKTKAAEPEAPASRKKAKATKGDGEVAVPSKKKKMLEAFSQQIAERISTESFDLLGRALADHGTFAVGPVAVGASYTEDALKVTITLMPTSKSEKEIKAYIRDNREATDVAPDDDEDDDSLDDELEDDDVDDEGEEDEDEDSELEEDEDEDEDEEDDEEEESEDDEAEDLTVDDMVGTITDLAPTLKAAKVQGFVEAYLASDEMEEKFGDDMVPSVTKLQAKEGGTEFLLVGYDEAEEQVKLLNLDTLKFRSKTVAEVARMEVVEDGESEEEDDGVDD